MVTRLGRRSSHHGGASRSIQSVNSPADHFWTIETIPGGRVAQILRQLVPPAHSDRNARIIWGVPRNHADDRG
jgi:hypothetical protein